MTGLDGAPHTPVLSPRQQQIPALIGGGLTNEIGERHGVAEKTIKNWSPDSSGGCLNMQRRSQAAVCAALRLAAVEPAND